MDTQDRNGRDVKIGDRILLIGLVTEVGNRHLGQDYNVSFELIDRLPSGRFVRGVCHSHQVEVVKIEDLLLAPGTPLADIPPGHHKIEAANAKSPS